MIRLHRDREKKYYQLFDYETGKACRWGCGNEDPFWREAGPELLDISITDYCERECDFCYRNAGKHGSFMKLELYEEILKQAHDAGVQQIALGGGNPNQHPEFIRFLQMARDYQIIPSYTTNGQGMTEEILQATKCYGGAVAVSWYEPYEVPLKVIEKCGVYDIPINIHFLLHKASVKKATQFLCSEKIPWELVNAIIFLNYKPMGFHVYEGLQEDEEMDAFLEMAVSFEKCKVGFDSCMISWLVKKKDWFAVESVDYCEAGRFSAFISEKGMVYPCSFLCGNGVSGENIKDKSFIQIWKNGIEFKKIREELQGVKDQEDSLMLCKSCKEYALCHGGCQKFAINRCR